MTKLSDTLLVDNSVASSAYVWSGGEGIVTAWASSWAGATITFQISQDGTNYVSAGSAGVFTLDGAANFKIPSGYSIKASISGSPTAAYVRVTDILKSY